MPKRCVSRNTTWLSCGVRSVTFFRSVLVVAAAAALAGCGSSGDAADQSPPSSSSTATSLATSSTLPTEVPEDEPTAEPETVAVEPAEDIAPAVVEPQQAESYIVACQEGLGPIETYWSDGTVTGYSDYCQWAKDDLRRSMIVADEAPSSGTNESEAWYTCGYDVLCDDNGIPTPGPEEGTLLGNGWTCAGNGCTRPR